MKGSNRFGFIVGLTMGIGLAAIGGVNHAAREFRQIDGVKPDLLGPVPDHN